MGGACPQPCYGIQATCSVHHSLCEGGEKGGRGEDGVRRGEEGRERGRGCGGCVDAGKHSHHVLTV